MQASSDGRRDVQGRRVHKRFEIFGDEWAALASEWPETSVLELDEDAGPPEPKRYAAVGGQRNVEARAEVPATDRPNAAPQTLPARDVKIDQATSSERSVSDTARPVLAKHVEGPIVRLTVLVGKSAGQIIELRNPRFVIGRDPKCQLRPNSEAISRLHTRIDQRDGRVFVRDLGAANGTMVNELELHAREVEVFDGDRLEIGPLVFTFSIQCRQPADGPHVDDMVASWVLEEGDAAPTDPTAFLLPVYTEQNEEPRPEIVKPPRISKG